MSGNQDSFEPRDRHDRQPPGREPRDLEEREPDDGEQRIGHARSPRNDDADDGYASVAHRPNRMPEREHEADEEELTQADLMEVLDPDDLEQMDGPDA
jgi:hypothetical protein